MEVLLVVKISGDKKLKLFVLIWFSNFAYNNSHKFWDQSPSPHYQCCLQVSETVPWHKFRCCDSANILQHWVGGGAWFISTKCTVPEFPKFFAGIDLVSIIYVRYCRKIWLLVCPLFFIHWQHDLFFFSFLFSDSQFAGVKDSVKWKKRNTS